MPHYVRLKPDHNLITPSFDAILREMELPTPEERWPFPQDEYDSHLIEVYKQGSEPNCQEFIASINDAGLRAQFEIINR